MNNTIKIAIALGLIAFTWVNAQIAESVSQAQLDRSYACWEAGITCPKFGFIGPIS